MHRLLHISFFLVLIMSALFAQDFDPIDDVQIRIETGYETDQLQLGIHFLLPEGYHIGANELLKFEFNLPVELVQKGTVVFPQTEGPEEFPYYVWDAEFQYQAKMLTSIEEKRDFQAVITYQICSEGENALCFPPVKQTVAYQLKPYPPGGEKGTGGIVFTQEGLSGYINQALQGSFLLVLALVFLGGILTSFTPCVYPMIPIIIGYIGARTERKIQGLILSLFFTLGMSLTYAILGLLAAQTGQVFGSLTQQPWVVLSIAAIFFVMALSMLGFFELQLPSAWIGTLRSRQRKGWLGAIFMGAIAGFIGAPCVGPVLITLLTFVSATGSLMKGFFLLLIYGFGMSALFVVIGTFTGALKSMPKAGRWMENIKYGFALLMFGLVFYFARPFLPLHFFLALVGAVFLLLSQVFWKNLRDIDSIGSPFWKTLVLLVAITGAYFWWQALDRIFDLNSLRTEEARPAPTPSQSLRWIINDETKAFQLARERNQPVLVDFYASWCVACNELEHITWQDPRVAAALGEFVLLKFDYSVQEDWQKEVSDKFGVQGLPTVLLLNSEQGEIRRFSGFRDADDFLNFLK